MLYRLKEFLLSFTIVAMLLFSAIGTTPVYADDGSATATPDAGTTVAPTDAQVVVTEAAPATDPIATDPIATDPTVTDPTVTDPTATDVPAVTPVDVQPTDVATETSPTATATTEPAAAVTAADASAPATPVLEQVPDNTTVTVLGSDGANVPLASQDAATAIASTSDPIWCPAGQAPTPGANGCTQSFSSFTALLTALSGNLAYQGAGTIYVQQGMYAGGEDVVDFNSSSYDLSNIKNFDLTIQGGWNTTNNTIDPASPSLFNIPITIGTSLNPWGGSLTFNDITINWAEGQTSLILNTQKDINLSNVSVLSAGGGTETGAELNAGGDVNINNARFDYNKVGAIIKAGHNVTIANTSFSNFANFGKDQRQVTGAELHAGGAVTLFNVYAEGNREVGMNIFAGTDNAQVGDVTFGSTPGCNHTIYNGNTRVNECSSFSGTNFTTTSPTGDVTYLGYGLQVETSGSIFMDLVTASSNFLWGAKLTPGVNGKVTISNSEFNNNTTDSFYYIDDTGLLIQQGGDVTLDNIQANNNRLIGATINVTGKVSILNSTFSDNKGVTLSSTGTPTFFGYGLQVVTDGAILLNTVTASNNNLAGAQLNAKGGNVTIQGSTFSNNSTGSATDALGRGLETTSAGYTFLTNVTLDHNQLYGADVTAGKDVFLDSVIATNNGQNGVSVKSNCNTVYLSNNLTTGTFSNNGQYGLSLINSNLDQSGLTVFASNAAGDIFQDPGTCVFGSTPPVIIGSSNTNPIVTNPIVTDPIVTDPTVTDPTVTDPTVTDESNTETSDTDTDQEETEAPIVITTDNHPDNHHKNKGDSKFTRESHGTLNHVFGNSNFFNNTFVGAHGEFGDFAGNYVYEYSTCDSSSRVGYGVLVIFKGSHFAELDDNSTSN